MTMVTRTRMMMRRWLRRRKRARIKHLSNLEAATGRHEMERRRGYLDAVFSNYDLIALQKQTGAAGRSTLKSIWL
jgi:hypothetical protein